MTGAGSYLHELRAATNPDKQSDSPRAFWGRTDSSRAQWKVGPANGRGGTAPGAAPGIRAGSRALPVLGGGVRRAGSLLGGLRSNGARVRRKETESRATTATGTGSMAAGIGRAAVAPPEPSPPLHGPAAAAPPPRPLTQLPSPGAVSPGEWGRGSLEASSAEAPSPTAGPLCPARTVGRCSLREARSRVASGAAPHPAALPLA